MTVHSVMREIINEMLREPKEWDDLNAVEAEVRQRMAHCVDDLKVAFQVAHSRRVGYPSHLSIEHYCLAGSIEKCIHAHGYMERCAGPITREVHEHERRTIAGWPERMVAFSRELKAASESEAARLGVQAFIKAIKVSPHVG